MSFPFPNAPPNPDNNPFFFFMRPKKRGNINLMPGEENKELEKIVLFNRHHNNNKLLHHSTAIHSNVISKRNTIKDSSTFTKQKSKSFSLLPKLGKHVVNSNSIYFGSDLNCYSNGMFKNEWIHVRRQCRNGLQSYQNKIPLILYELNKRKEEHNKRINNTSLRNYRIERRLSFGNRTKHSKFIPKDFDLFSINLQRKSVKTKSLFSGSVTSEINEDDEDNNNSVKLNLDFAISIGKKEQNDYTKFNYFFLQHLFGINNYYIYGILEGQGFQGTLLARLIKDELIERFSSPKMYKSKGIYPTLEEVYESLIENDYEGIKNMFKKILLSLQDNEFDYTLSGALINIIIIIKSKLISINIGNIESYLISKRNNNNNIEQVVTVQLNKLHSTNDIIELDRIENENGVVHETNNTFKGKGFNYYNETYVEFVNERFSDNIIYTRVFGFSEVNKIGIINEPEITIKDLSNDAQYIIIASHYFFDYYKMSYYSRIINKYFEQKKKVNPIVIINNIMNISKTKSFETHNDLFKERCIALIIFNFN